MTISHLELLAALVYDPDTGLFRWRSPRKKIVVGAVAGTVRKDGRRIITLNGKWYLDSRLAWLYVTGHWPEYEIDHEDRDPGNCRWSNLREATSSQQKFNRGVRKDSTIGLKGVTRAKKRFRARIQVDGKMRELGLYDTAETAARVYRRAARRLHGEFFAGDAS